MTEMYVFKASALAVMRCVLCALAFAPSLAYSQNNPATKASGDISGEWSSDWGDVVLTKTTNGFAGTYVQDNGIFKLRHTGVGAGDYNGEWAEDVSAVRCETPSLLSKSYYWGTLHTTVPTKQKTITIKWGYCNDSDQSRTWQLTSKTPSQPEKVKPTNPFVGNWLVNWEGSAESQAMISIYKEFKWDCLYSFDGWCREVVAADAPYILDGGQMSPGDSGHPSSDELVFSDSELKIAWGYYHLGHWGGDSRLSSSDASNLSGKWEYDDDNKGAETWTRVLATVKHTETGTEREMKAVAELKPVGQAVTLKTTYVQPGYSMRGNRDEVFLNLYGENMWGKHHYYLPKESGLELSNFSHLCKDGEVVTAWDKNRSCTDSGGVIGAQLGFVVWSHAAPGIKTLKFDTQRIPFNLEVDNYPTPPKEDTVPKLSFLLSDDNREVNSLSYEDVFKIRAVYTSVQTKQEVPVELAIDDGKFTITLFRMSGGLTFESKRLQLGLPGLQNEETP